MADAPYLDLITNSGFRGVASRIIRSHEKSSGYNDKYTEFEFAGERDGVFWHVQMTEYSTVAPGRARSDFSKDSEQRLAEAEYRALLARLGGAKDTPEYFTEKAARQARQKAQEAKDAANRAAYEAMRPNCTCGAKMKLRENQKNHTFFWGCSTFPTCKATRNISSAQRSQLRRLGHI